VKIISIGPASPLRGGIAKFNESFSVACKTAGNDVEMISFRFLYPGFLFPGKSQFATDPPPKGIVIHTWLHSINPLNWIVSARKIIKLKPDLIVIHYWMPFFAPVMGFIARQVKRKTHCRILAVTHNLIPHEKQAFSGILTTYFLNSIDGLVCLSSSVLNDLKKFETSIPALHLPHPVYDIYGSKLPKEDAFKYLHLDPAKKYLLFFGLIRKYKGLDLLLHSFSRIEMPELNLLVAGEFYEHKTSYFELAEDLGISDRVVFLDTFIPDEDVKYYFSAAEMVVQPYITATQSGVTQIAYQFDCPMLVTNTGGLGEIVMDNETGFVCEKDPREIAEKITLFFKNKLGPAMVEKIKIEKHKFSWESFVEKVIKLAKDI
jgi:glycosyltransferase involved in cell wall biosynthesis